MRGQRADDSQLLLIMLHRSSEDYELIIRQKPENAKVAIGKEKGECWLGRREGHVEAVLMSV